MAEPEILSDGKSSAQCARDLQGSSCSKRLVHTQQASAASAASTDTSGNFTCGGAGHTTSTYDLNAGVGTVNLLQLGVPATRTTHSPVR